MQNLFILVRQALERALTPFQFLNGRRIIFISLFFILIFCFNHKTYSQCNAAVSCVTNFSDYHCITGGSAMGQIGPFGLKNPTDAATMPQKLIVTGILTMDLDYQFAVNSDIVMLPGSEIIVSHNLTVQSHVTIRGCGGAWTDIKVTSAGTLLLQNSSISNSCGGINLEAAAHATIVGNIFTDNHTCIQSTGSVLLLGEGIAHNTFDGTTDTNSGCPSPHAAIVLTNVGNITIGNVSGTGAPNRILNYSKGLTALNTQLTITNTWFNIPSTIPGSVAVDLKNTSSHIPQATINGNGLNYVATDQFFINNYEKGIQSENYNLVVKNAYFVNNNSSIQIQHTSGNPTFPTKLDVENCQFQDYATNGIFASNLPFTIVTISGNRFLDGSQLTEGETWGVRWYQNTQTKSFEMTGNHFYDNAKPVLIVSTNQHVRSYSIFATVPRQLNIHGNYFYQNYAAVDHEFDGINIYGSPNTGASIGNKILDNEFIANFGPGIYSSPSTDDLICRGLKIYNAPYNTYSCNRVQGLNVGVHFNGISCDHTTFKYNTMKGNLTGLYLYDGTVIGQQIAQENTWPGDLPSGGVDEAKFDGMPGQGALLASRFAVNDLAHPQSDYWPNPREPMNSMNDWFVGAFGTPSPVLHCYISNGDGFSGKSEADRQIIEGEYQPYKGYPATTWETTLNAFGTFYNSPELLTSENNITQQFYSVHNTDNIGKIYRALVSWENAKLFTAPLQSQWDTNQASLDQIINALAYQDASMEQAQSFTDQQLITQSISTLQGQLATLHQNSESLTSQYQSDVTGRINQLLTDLSNISTTNVWETNVITVLTLSSQRLLNSNDDWTLSQKSILQAIAGQCRFEGGIGVVMARAAIASYRYDDAVMCPGVSNSRNSIPYFLASLTPNPSNNICRINFDKIFSGAVAVASSNGQVLENLQIENASFYDLDTHALPNGLYLITLKSAEGHHSTHKLSVIH